MAMLPNEITMLKAVSMNVDDKHVLIASEQYHTEKTDQGKRNKAKSLYRWFAKVKTIDGWKSYIDDLRKDENRLVNHKIPNDNVDYFLNLGNSSSKGTLADWLEIKLKKAKSWEDGQKHLKGWKKKSSSYSPKDGYETENYKAENGDIVSLANQKQLLEHVDQNLSRIV